VQNFKWYSLNWRGLPAGYRSALCDGFVIIYNYKESLLSANDMESCDAFLQFSDCDREGAEDVGYLAYSPTLPGCFSNGATIEEAKRNIREAVQQHVTSLEAHGQPIEQQERLVHVEELTVGVPE